jgi:hypothetical protein
MGLKERPSIIKCQVDILKSRILSFFSEEMILQILVEVKVL